MKRILVAVLVAVMTGCGGGSSDSGNASGGGNSNQVLADEYLGAWKSTNGIFVSIGKSAITAYGDAGTGCYEPVISAYSSVTNNSFTTIVDGKSSVTNVSLHGSGQLIVQEEDLLLFFNKLNLVPNLTGCDQGEVVLNVELAELPSTFKVNRESQSMYQTEIIYDFIFDLDETGTRSSGDLRISASHNKENEIESFISINELNVKIGVPQYMPGPPPEENLGLYDLVYISQTGTITSNGNTFSITIDKSANPLLSLIQPETPVSVISYLSYPSPENDNVWSGANDGPWNWSSERHEDSFPTEELSYKPISWLNSQTDAEGDQSGESQWIDIKSTNISITN
ncbi:hypothetical protein [Agarivorans sp. DSG3-1]|uniref:hypothetical protein n=1 Tax=Agarivorans sp. DSG3-1 TaxID=3342249 RepID=UPI00398F5FFC